MRVATVFGVAFAASFIAAAVTGGCGATADDSVERFDVQPSPTAEAAQPTAVADVTVPTQPTAPTVRVPAPEPDYVCSCPEQWLTPVEVDFEIDGTWTVDDAGQRVSPAIAMSSGTVRLSADGKLLVRYEVEGASVEVVYLASVASAR